MKFVFIPQFTNDPYTLQGDNNALRIKLESLSYDLTWQIIKSGDNSFELSPIAPPKEDVVKLRRYSSLVDNFLGKKEEKTIRVDGHLLRCMLAPDDSEIVDLLLIGEPFLWPLDSFLVILYGLGSPELAERWIEAGAST